MSDSEDFFDEMDAADAANNYGSYMSEGKYRVQLLKLAPGRSRPPKKEKLFIVEFLILANHQTVEAGMSEARIAEIEANRKAHGVGSKGSWAPKRSQDKTAGNIKQLMLAVIGKDATKTSKDDPDQKMAAALGAALADDSAKAKAYLAEQGIDDPAGAVVDEIVELECRQITTKAGSPFTVYSWSPYKKPE